MLSLVLKEQRHFTLVQWWGTKCSSFWYTTSVPWNKAHAYYKINFDHKNWAQNLGYIICN
jgi:hypothetical protein